MNFAFHWNLQFLPQKSTRTNASNCLTTDDLESASHGHMLYKADFVEPKPDVYIVLGVYLLQVVYHKLRQCRGSQSSVARL